MATFNFSKADPTGSETRPWIWKNHIPHYLVTTVSGDSAVGKSRTIASILKCHISDEAFPDGDMAVELPSKFPPKVLLLNNESDDSEIGQTYQAQGWTDYELEHNLEIIRTIKNNGKTETFNIDNTVHLETLYRVVKDIHPSVIVIDPLVEYHRRNTISDIQMRELLAKLGNMAQTWRVAIISMAHWNKNEKQSYGNRMAGSHQMLASVRSAIAVYREPNGQRIFQQQKNSNGPEQPPLGFTITEPNGMVLWGKLANSALDGNLKITQSECWLKDLLTTHGETPVAECIKLGLTQGFSERTLRQARHNLDFEIYRRWKQLGPTKVAVWGIRQESNKWGQDFGIISTASPGSEPDFD